MGKESTCKAGDSASILGPEESLGQEESLEEEIATHPSDCRKIPWAEGAYSRLQAMGLAKIRHS